MNKQILSVALAVTLFACLILSISLIKINSENKRLRQAEETQELASCYLCGGNVKIKPVNERFYIECEDCELHTAYFDSKSESVNYWNKNKESEE